MLSTAKLKPLAIFKNVKVFSENPFFLAKNPNFWKFWEISLFPSHWTSNLLTVSVAVDIKLAKFSCFQKFRFSFSKKPSFFQKSNFRVILLIQSILLQVCYFLLFNKTVQDVFSRNQSTFSKQNNFSTFWETLLFHSLSTAKLLSLVFFKKVQSYSENLSIFIKKLKIFEPFEKTANFISN